MINKRDLLDNELLKEIISIRVDTLWRMLSLEKDGYLPKENDEGATGHLDNKGGIFIPGGLIFEDSDKNAIEKSIIKNITIQKFKKLIHQSMEHDNATLLFRDGFALGVNLDNGFFSELSSLILSSKRASHKRSTTLNKVPPLKSISGDIARSHSQLFVKPPYGSRTKLSSCIAVCLSEPRLYYILCRSEFSIRGKLNEQLLWDNIRSSKEPVVTKEKKVLVPPYVVVCHTTRYKKEIYTGITKLLGIGKFGEFAVFTLERVTSELFNEIDRKSKKIYPNEIFAEYNGRTVVGVLRLYPGTEPGKRSKKFETQLVLPYKDLELDLDAIKKNAAIRYNIDIY
jgi:hypothetical protein